MKSKIIDFQKILYPEEYPSDYIVTYPLFNNELKELIEKSGYIKIFKVKYYKSLRFLEQLGRNCVMQPNIFEKLVKSDGIYSMILKGEKNIRILFSFEYVKNKEKVVIYNCFQERRTKDYSKEIILAKKRRKDFFDA